MKHFFRKNLGIILTLLIVGLLGTVLAVLWAGSGALVHPQRRALEPRHHEVNAHPAEFGLDLERIEIPVGDGVVLKGCLAGPCQHPGAAERTRRMRARLDKAGVTRPGQPRGTVVLLHGRGGIKEDMLTVAQRFVAADFRCVVYDARAHGESGGAFCTFGQRETGDLSSVLDHVEGLLRSRGETTGPFAGFGISLGAAVLLQAMPREPRIAAAVAAAPFAGLEEEVLHAIGNATSHRVPKTWRRLVLDTAAWRGGFVPSEIMPERSAAAITQPVLITHGALDKVIPVEQGRRIFAALPAATRCSWIEIPDGYHGNVLAKGGDDLYEKMILFYLRAIEKP